MIFFIDTILNLLWILMVPYVNIVGRLMSPCIQSSWRFKSIKKSNGEFESVTKGLLIASLAYLYFPWDIKIFVYFLVTFEKAWDIEFVGSVKVPDPEKLPVSLTNIVKKLFLALFTAVVEKTSFAPKMLLVAWSCVQN